MRKRRDDELVSAARRIAVSLSLRLEEEFLGENNA